MVPFKYKVFDFTPPDNLKHKVSVTYELYYFCTKMVGPLPDLDSGMRQD